jgi:hypothetical protein
VFKKTKQIEIIRKKSHRFKRFYGTKMNNCIIDFIRKYPKKKKYSFSKIPDESLMEMENKVRLTRRPTKKKSPTSTFGKRPAKRESEKSSYG